VKKILLLTVGALLVIGLIGAGTFAISRDVEAGTGEDEPAFNFTELVISPTKVAIGQNVTISLIVTNVGDWASSFGVILRIDGVIEATKKVTLDGDASEGVTFTISKDVAGTYSVSVGHLTGSFKVKESLSTTPTGVIIGIIAAVVVVVLVFFLVRRKALAGK